MAQGTIKDFDDESRTGLLVMEDRSEVRIDPSSLEGAGILTLRLGQRVKFELADEAGGMVARTLRLVTVD